MEELRLLIEMVAELPPMAMWVLVGFFAYKVIVVGSVYGVVRFVGGRLFDWLQQQKAREVEYKEVRPKIDGLCIDGQADRLIAQLHRLVGKGTGTKGLSYIHGDSVDWLRDAIDKKIEEESSSGKKAASA